MRRHLDRLGWTNADLARAVQAHGGTLEGAAVSKWDARGLTPTPDTVRLVALAIGRPVLEALRESGLFTATDLQVTGSVLDPATMDLSSVPHERLLAELGARLNATRPARGRPRRKKSPAAPSESGDAVSVPASDGTADSVTVEKHEPTGEPGDMAAEPDALAAEPES